MSVGGSLGGGSGRVGGREIAAWTAAALLQFIFWTATTHPRLSNDSYQYLSVAENVAAGHGVETSLVHFDVERAHGTLPAPLTTFAPGYSIAVAGLCKLGLPPESAAKAVSILAMALAVALLAFACNALELDVWVSRSTILVFTVNAYTLWFAGSVATEALFTLFFLASVTCALGAERAESERRLALFSAGAGLFAGLAYDVRYAGLLVIAGLGLAQGTLFLVRRTRRSVVTMGLTMMAALVPVTITFARNIRLTGTWQGGNTKVVHHPLVEMIKKSVTSFIHLFVGEAVTRPARVCQLIVVLALGFVLVRWRRLPRGPAAARAFIVATVMGVYCLLMFYVGLHSVISYAARMFLPALPLLLLAFAAIVAKPPRTALAGRVFALAGFAAYALCVALNFSLRRPRPRGTSRIASRLVQPAPDGKPLAEWIDAHIGPHEPVMAADGQATGYWLRRPTVSLVGVEYSEEIWNESEIERTMERFGVRYLILYTHPTGAVERESPFLMSLIEGHPDAHLRLAIRNDQALVFERVRPGG